jgi:hypothetical protein
MFGNAVDYEGDADCGEPRCHREKYVMWGFSAHDETLNLP